MTEARSLESRAIETAEEFGRLVRERRRALKLQQRDLALAANVGERFVVELEAGKPTCQLGKALAVARALGIRLRDASFRAPAAGAQEGYLLPDIDPDEGDDGAGRGDANGADA